MAKRPTRREVDLSRLVVRATRPRRQAARRLKEMGLTVIPVEEDEGDVERFVLSKRLAAERRTGHSLLNGIMDKTLFVSAVYLREHFRMPVLIVEGDIDYTYRGFDPQAVRGALSSMLLEYGLNVIATRDLEDTAQLVAMMARHEQIGIPEISFVPKRKAVGLPDMQRRVIEMLPGSGRVMARELLGHFGSIGRTLRATEDELLAVRGVGRKKARDMRKVLAAEYEAVDTERQFEDTIEADPSLLFEEPVELLARQHHIYDDERERHVVDMVFRDAEAGEIILVELKRARLEPWHFDQIRRYLDHARESALIRRHLDAGDELRGILASPEPGRRKAHDDDVTIRRLDTKRAVEILKRLRAQRLGDG